MIVQIYEIQTPEEALEMVRLGVDHIGSVIQSKKQWEDRVLKNAITVIRANGCKSSLIPLFDDIDVIIDVIEYYQPDIIHFCDTLPIRGDIDAKTRKFVDQQITIKTRFPNLGIMRSIPIGIAGLSASVPSLQWASLLEPVSDYFLTDTLLTETESNIDEDACVEQPVDGYVGITGETCDWHIARQLVRQSRIPVILAGGISPGNARAAVKQVRPFGVDSCTQTNAVNDQGRPIRFKKDLQKVRSLINAVRSDTE